MYQNLRVAVKEVLRWNLIVVKICGNKDEENKGREGRRVERRSENKRKWGRRRKKGVKLMTSFHCLKNKGKLTQDMWMNKT